MFFNAPGNPSRLKRIVYLFAATSLGVLLSFVAHALIESSYLRWAESQGLIAPFYGGCTLPPALQIGLLALGAIGGFFLGRLWWRKVYIERIWAKKYPRVDKV